MKLYVFLILSFFLMQNCAQKKVDLTKPQQQTTMEDNTHANNPYYSRTDKEAKQIIDSAKQRLNEAGLNQFERYVENQRDKKGTQIIY